MGELAATAYRMMPSQTVTIELSADEALVLRSFVERGDDVGEFIVIHGGELAVLWKLEGLLEKVMLPPEDEGLSYEDALQVARTRLANQAGTHDWQSLLR